MVVLGEAGRLLMSEVLVLHVHVHSRNALNSVGVLFCIACIPIMYLLLSTRSSLHHHASPLLTTATSFL